MKPKIDPATWSDFTEAADTIRLDPNELLDITMDAIIQMLSEDQSIELPLMLRQVRAQ